MVYAEEHHNIWCHMPKRVPLTKETVDWLHLNHTSTSYHEMAAHIGCCVDTLKRILVRHGLQEFEGAKYVLPKDHGQEHWERPCIQCGNKQKRPKNFYMCLPCRSKAGYKED